MQKSSCNLTGQLNWVAPPGLSACLLILCGILCIPIPDAFAQSLSLNSQHGAVGDTIAVTIRIDSAYNAVEAFGFDVIYDPDVLRYTGVFTQGDAIRNFDFFNVSAPGQGRARVGGFTIKQRIEPGQSGQLVTLEFEVRSAGQSNLSVTRLLDDMAGWSAPTSHFESTSTAHSTQQSEDIASLSDPDQPEVDTSLPPASTPSERAERGEKLSKRQVRASPTQSPSPLLPSTRTGPVGTGWTAQYQERQTVRPTTQAQTGRLPQSQAKPVEQPMKQARAARPESGSSRDTMPPSEQRSTRTDTPPVAAPDQELSVAPVSPPTPAPLSETPPTVSTPVITPLPGPAPMQPGTTIKTNAKEITGGHFRFLRTTVPIVALFLLGCVIVALLSLKGRS